MDGIPMYFLILLYLTIAIALVVLFWFVFWGEVFWYSNPMLLPVSYFSKTSPNSNRKYTSKHKLCVIGAGFCGIGVMGAFKRHEIPFDCFETRKNLGGNWSDVDGGVFETTHIISSAKTTEYKDFPMPSSYPPFPSAKQVHEYLTEYVRTNDLLENIHYQATVTDCRLKIKKNIEGEDESVWEVTVDFGNGKITKGVYEAVVICNGHHWDKRMPQYEGMEQFKGEIIHSKDYRLTRQLEGKRILTIGGGNSACDCAVDAARFGYSSTISQRRGYWFLPRAIFGIPLIEIIRPYYPMWLQRLLLKFFVYVTIGSYEKYGLQTPDHEIFEHHPSINSELLHFLQLGRIKPKPDIKRFKPNSKVIEFVNGTEEEFDLVICATGYRMNIPMAKDYVTFKDGIPQLIGGLFFPGYRNIFYFGMGQVRYGAGSLISVGAEVLAEIIQYHSENKDLELGSIFEKLVSPMQKSEKSADVLVDPFTLMRQLQFVRLTTTFFSWWVKMFKAKKAS